MFIKRNYTSIWNCWIQKFKPQKISSKRKKINEFVIDETLFKVGSSKYIWSWVAIEPEGERILGFNVSKKNRNMLIAEKFFANIAKVYDKHPVSTNSGKRYPPQACHFIKLQHHTSILLMKEASLLKE